LDLIIHVSVAGQQLRATIDEVHRQWDADELAASQLQPQPKFWRKIMTPQFGADRNLRFADLNQDGRIDLLIGQVMHHGPTDTNSEIACMTAIDLDGEILWKQGTPDRWHHHLTNDVAFQVHDLDGDGKNEVIYCKDHELVVAEGATGQRLRGIPTPTNTSTRIPFNRFPRILGDSLLVADLRGLGHRGDIVLKDRYQHAWAFDDQLNSLWTVECNTGHFPFPIDTDGDGREEISLGYSRWSPDGKQIWSHDELLKDHADAVAVVDLDGDGSLETIYGASDEGFILLDADGVPRVHLRIGHVQNLTVAELRPDLPGLEIAAANFWKNQGLIHILDRRGSVVADFEPRPEHGSSIVPVNWRGDGVELLFIGPDPVHGGLFDGFGHKVVKLPADGHPTKAYDALDLTGDSRDELVVWDSQEIWIYTASSKEAPLKPAPIRNSLSNESNYRARVSVPAKISN
jgi:rhamnogalacturonan endolyase